MPTEIPDLWGGEIHVDVLSPLAVLRAQAEAIRKKTSGLLTGEVSTHIETSGETGLEYEVDSHVLELVAVALDYREAVLEVWHKTDKAYPVHIVLPEPIYWAKTHAKASKSGTAYTAEEYIELLGVALQSRPTRAAIDTLLAKSNEASPPHGSKKHKPE